MDLNMPVMDGYETLIAVQEDVDDQLQLEMLMDVASV
jgi:CheY-like chemotaxis protein